MTSISLFAHKGGVGKSTLLFDIAYYLSSLNYNIVILDCDTQLNTTFKLLSRNNIQINGNLINQFIAQSNNIQNKVLIDQINRDTLYNYIGTGNFNITHQDLLTVNNTNNKIKFILGSPILYNLELQLTNAINMIQNVPGLANIPTAFYNLLNQIKNLYNNNVIILVDMSPNSGIFNQNILLSCDYFILPVNPDHNSMIGIELLSHHITQWRQTHNYLNHNVKFLFSIFNRYKYHHGGLSNTSLNYRNYLETIITNFNQIGNNVNHNRIGIQKIFNVQDMMRFSDIISNDKISIFELTNQNCYNNNTTPDDNKVASIEQEIVNICNCLISNNII